MPSQGRPPATDASQSAEPPNAINGIKSSERFIFRFPTFQRPAALDGGATGAAAAGMTTKGVASGALGFISVFTASEKDFV
jgi:hypothetical protein